MNKDRVALVHVYLTDRDGKDRPDRFTRLGVLAASELYRHKEIDKICLTTIPELSDLQLKRLKILLNNPPSKDIIVEPKSMTTRGEIETFREVAKKNKWDNLLTIANRDHLTRIRKEIERTFKNDSVETFSSREILGKYPRYSGILSEMDNWNEQVSFSFQEKILNMPILGSFILNLAPYISKYKVALQYKVWAKIENFKSQKSPNVSS